MDVLTANKRHLTQENVDVAKKGKSFLRNWIFSNSSDKQYHKDQSYQSEKK